MVGGWLVGVGMRSNTDTIIVFSLRRSFQSLLNILIEKVSFSVCQCNSFSVSQARPG